MSIIFRDPEAQALREADYRQQVDNAMRTGGPYPAPPPVDNETVEFERGIRFSDRRGAYWPTGGANQAPYGPPGGGRLPEQPVPIDQSFPSKGTPPFTLKGGR